MLKNIIEMGKGEKKADVLLKGGKLVNVFSGEVSSANVAIGEGVVVGVGKEYLKAKRTFEVKGKYIIPGLIDSHVHIESSLVSVPEFARAVVPHGTTTVIIDPHEIANVLGVKGIKYMLDSSRGIPLDVFVMVSSCVPATDMETAGAKITAQDIANLFKWDKVLGLAEFMNYPGVICEIPDVLAKISAAEKQGKIIDGHAPGLSGTQLQAYLDAGIDSDHECTTAQEAKEKLRLGTKIMMREGSAAKNLAALLPIVNKTNSRRVSFATDDRHPQDLIKEGHMDNILRKAVVLGLDPVQAVQMATINTAEYFGLRKLGAVAPGYAADVAVVNNLENFKISLVFKKGKLVARDGKLTTGIVKHSSKAVRNTMKHKLVTKDDLKISLSSGKARVIGIIPDQIITKTLTRNVKTKNGFACSDTKKDILKVAVIERHKQTGNIGVGFIHGLGLRKGALASSFAHDSHNLIVIGTSDEEILAAIKEIDKIGGGYVVISDGKPKASLPLPIAGLMSDKPVTQVSKALTKLHQASKKLGTKLSSPFITLSFCALPVIPELKITDKGLVDVGRFCLVPVDATKNKA